MAQKVTAGVYKGVTTTELDELAAETAAGMTSLHPDYAVVRTAVQTLASRALHAQLARVSARQREQVHMQRVARDARRQARRAAARKASLHGSLPPFFVRAVNNTHARDAACGAHRRRLAAQDHQRVVLFYVRASSRVARAQTVLPFEALLPALHPACGLTRCAARLPALSIKVLYEYVNPRSGLKAPLIAEDVYKARRAPCAVRMRLSHYCARRRR